MGQLEFTQHRCDDLELGVDYVVWCEFFFLAKTLYKPKKKQKKNDMINKFFLLLQKLLLMLHYKQK